MTLNAIIYSALTLLVLYSAASMIAPVQEPTQDRCQVSYVYDGDTVALRCGDDGEQTARLKGFDTPETKKPGCDAELALGKQATARLRELVKDGPIEITQHGYEKYGRLLIRLTVSGVDVGDVLIAEGLAAPYRGGTRRDWCAALQN